MPDSIASDAVVRLVAQLADLDSADLREQLYRCLLSAQLGEAVLEGHNPSTAPASSTQEVKRAAFPHVTDSNGNTYLHVYCDIHRMTRAPRSGSFFTVDGRTVVRMSAESGIGIVLACGSISSKPWVVVPAADAKRILDESSSG